ncbi:MAG: 30S ribosomal protein S16 [Patescibacteria group bacterium]
MLKIRLTRVGRKNDPHFRVVVIDSRRAPKSGDFIEIVGNHHPRQKQTALKHDRIAYWRSQGAQMSATVGSLVRKTKEAAAQVGA